MSEAFRMSIIFSKRQKNNFRRIKMSRTRIAVINGSPKGSNSITLQTILYIRKHFPDHEFAVIPAAARIHSYEKDMSRAIDTLQKADLILFSYPVYTFLVPSQLHRFLELMKESGVDFSGKYMSQVSTSKHFYDVTAHHFLEENCRDMGMKVIRGLSADMEDLTKEKGRKQALDFFRYVLWKMGKGKPQSPDDTAKEKPIVIVTDAAEENEKLLDMIAELQHTYPYPSKVVNIRDFGIRGGCLGCLRCAATGKCIYKDGFSELLRDEIQGGGAIVYAFTLQDHSMGSYFKMYDDRQFCNGHRTVTMGSPIGYLVQGDLTKEENLRLVLEARAEAGGNFLAGIACDENSSCSIAELAENLAYGAEQHYAPPSNFLGVGGIRIFRDLIYQMQGIMKEDHKFFKQHGMYDFPQNKKGTIMAMYLVGAVFENEKLMTKMGGKMEEGMMMGHKKALKK